MLLLTQIARLTKKFPPKIVVNNFRIYRQTNTYLIGFGKPLTSARIKHILASVPLFPQSFQANVHLVPQISPRSLRSTEVCWYLGNIFNKDGHLSVYSITYSISAIFCVYSKLLANKHTKHI